MRSAIHTILGRFAVLAVTVATRFAVGNTPAAAQPVPPVYGFGAASCAQFLADIAGHDDAAKNNYFSWSQGFITAANALMAREVGMVASLPGKVPIYDQQGFLIQLCNGHRDMDYSCASMKLLDKLRSAEGLLPILTDDR